MFIFGHLGIGLKIASPWTASPEYPHRLPRRGVLLGAILPDLIDKPLYYGLVLATGRRGAELGLISGTRTFGHTAIALLAITLVAVAKKSRAWAAVAVGMATHLLLDNIVDRILQLEESSATLALLFPVFSERFAVAPFATFQLHMAAYATPFLLSVEAIGMILLSWEYWILTYSREVNEEFKLRRFLKRKLRANRRKPPV